MRIDCEECPNRQGETRCEGCLIDFVLELDQAMTVEGDETVLLEADVARAVRALADAGLLGEVRRIPRREAG